MCGIIGYCGNYSAFSFLYEGLKRLEYRGYDSVGICIDGKVIKMKGHVDQLNKCGSEVKNSGNCGIGHTRWATHGEPTYINAHPHSSGNIHIVHNGIIENYKEIKEELTKKGYNFVSQTDTEAAAHLINYYYKGDLQQAVLSACKELKGSYAFVAMCEKKNQLVAVRKESPLIVGRGKEGVHLASDISAIADKCDELFVLDNGELAVIKDREISFFDMFNAPIIKLAESVDKNYESVSKEGYATFMEKEINEGAKSVKDTIEGYKDNYLPSGFLEDIKSIYFCACGTAYHACCYGKKLIERYVKIPCFSLVASEFKEPYTTDYSQCLFVFISQSGETADTLAAHTLAKKYGAKTLAVTNVSKSSLEEVADAVVKTRAGREYAVASTKAYLAQLGFCLYFTQYLCDTKNIACKLTEQENLDKLYKAMDSVGKISQIKELANNMLHEEHAYFLGRGLDYVTASEASLKLKEITYIHSEAYPAGELKHGTLALIEKDTKVIAFLTQSELKEKMIGNISEVIARGAQVTLFSQYKSVDCDCDKILLPPLDDVYMPLVSIVPCQRLAFLVSVAKGLDCDKPRNLAKSVTVQ